MKLMHRNFFICCLLLFALFVPSHAQRPAANRPNIVFIEVDDLTYKYLSAFGAKHIRTPNIDRLAQRGVVFENAIVQGVMCSPSRNSLITARYPQNLGLYSNGDINQMPKTMHGFPLALQQAGYRTSWIGKSHILPFVADQRGRAGEQKTAGMKQLMGFDEVWQSAGRHVALKKARTLNDGSAWKKGIDAYADYLQEKGLLKQFLQDGTRPTTLNVDDYLDGLIAKLSVDWIGQYQRNEPFFLWVNFSGPHGPYNPPAKYLKLYQPEQMPKPILDIANNGIPDSLRTHEWTKNERQTMLARTEYAGMITFIDEQVGRILDALEKKRLNDKTVIVFFSDHGIMDGDHGLMHKETIFKEALNASLIIVDPRGGKGTRVSRPVELLDLARTVLDIGGAKPEAAHPLFGESLLPLLRGNEKSYQRKFAIAQIRGANALVTADYKYIEAKEGPVLFDLKRDPDELKNVAAENAKLCQEFQAQLDQWKKAHGPIIKPGSRKQDDIDK